MAEDNILHNGSSPPYADASSIAAARLAGALWHPLQAHELPAGVRAMKGDPHGLRPRGLRRIDCADIGHHENPGVGRQTRWGLDLAVRTAALTERVCGPGFVIELEPGCLIAWARLDRSRLFRGV